MNTHIMYCYYGNDLVSRIEVDGEKVTFVNYTDDLVLLPFGNRDSATLEDVKHYLESRCFPKTRGNCKQLLDDMNLPFYDPLQIIKITHGAMVDDLFWIRFEGEDLTWDQVNPRKLINEGIFNQRN